MDYYLIIRNFLPSVVNNFPITHLVTKVSMHLISQITKFDILIKDKRNISLDNISYVMELRFKKK